MFRVMTANLYNGRARATGLARVLDELRPDFMAAQELAPETATVIEERFPHGLIAPARDHTGMALVGTHPLRARRQTLPHRDALVADGPFRLWCVHLANPVDLPPPWRARRRQVSTLADLVDRSPGATLLVGDLNSTPAWPAYRRLRRHLDDGVADWAQRTGRRPARTWGYKPSMPPLLRIDHALVRDVKVHDAFTVRIPGCDHRALVIDVV